MIFVSEITLRNRYQVFEYKNHFRVAKTGQMRKEYPPENIEASVIEYVRSQLVGKMATVEQAEKILKSSPSSLKLPYRHGYKLHFFAQDVLIVLAAKGYAEIQKKGNRYNYWIRSSLKE